MPEKKAQMEAIYTHMWASHEGGPFASLDESLHPRPHTMLYEVASACGVNASSLILDIGSGRGNHSCALARRFGCAVVGLDLAELHIEQGRARAMQEGVSDRVSFVQGDIEALPFENKRFGFLWSRDMLMHVPVLPQALLECARVLKPAGAMLVYTTVATGRMEPKEAAWLYASFGLVPESMGEGAVEAAFQVAGLQMHSKEQLGSELMEWVEEHEGRASRELMRLARMLRRPEYYQELLGASRYEVALANYHWADMEANPNLVRWLDRRNVGGQGKLALVVGCGLGDDAEELAQRGFEVVAFDIAPTAIAWCQQRFPHSPVAYVVADVFDPPSAWQGGFDFVLEAYTLQVLPADVRSKAIACIAGLLAKEGTLLVICRGRSAEEPPGNLPWPLTTEELDGFKGAGLRQGHFEDYFDQEEPPKRRFRVEYQRASSAES